MNITDSIGDFLTRIRNSIKVNHRMVSVPASKLRKEITRTLHEQGYILDYKFEDTGPQGQIKIALKYHPVTKVSVIREIRRVSKPGLRKYSNVNDLPRVLNGLGVALISTSKGVMTDKQARKENLGGEILCYVY